MNSLGYTPVVVSGSYPFPTILDPVQVPPGYFSIEIAQFWRGERERGHPFPLHWTLIVRTCPNRGNTHEIVGDSTTYATQDNFDIPLHHEYEEDWRGTHVIGYVSPVRMHDFLSCIALVPVVRYRCDWNCQSWVYDVLKALKSEGVYSDAANVTFEALKTHMLCLLDAWEMGDI